MKHEVVRISRGLWPPTPGLLALLVCCLIVGVVYFTHRRDPLAFALIGDRFASGDPAGVKGYDGQFAYYIAADPVGALARLDKPSLSLPADSLSSAGSIAFIGRSSNRPMGAGAH